MDTRHRELRGRSWGRAGSPASRLAGEPPGASRGATPGGAGQECLDVPGRRWPGTPLTIVARRAGTRLKNR